MKYLPEYLVLGLLVVVAGVLMYRDSTKPHWSLEEGCEVLGETDTSLLIWCDEQVP